MTHAGSAAVDTEEVGHERRRVVVLGPPGGIRPSTWSGIPQHMVGALRDRHAEVTVVAAPHTMTTTVGKIRDRVYRKLLGRGRAYAHDIRLAKSWGRSIARRIPAGTDFVVAPAGSTHLAFLDCSVPVIYTADTTFALLSGYYPEFSSLTDRYLDEANEIEQRAIDRAEVLAYPSRWAADSALQDYGADASRVHVIPYGANLSRVPDSVEIANAKTEARCELIFLGVDWKRKGGPLAYETTAILRERGIDAKLTIVGCNPDLDSGADSWIDIIPYVDKSAPEGSELLQTLLLRSSFLLLPTRRECFGIVFCEASAHGTPSLATDTGGVAGAVNDGENGYLLGIDTPAEGYADLVQDLHADRPRYRSLVRTSRSAYEERLNWPAWASAASTVIESVL
ncbi:MAG: glycosyltransferase family 4 protein [Gemmatimonadota bacterium]